MLAHEFLVRKVNGDVTLNIARKNDNKRIKHSFKGFKIVRHDVLE